MKRKTRAKLEDIFAYIVLLAVIVAILLVALFIGSRNTSCNADNAADFPGCNTPTKDDYKTEIATNNDLMVSPPPTVDELYKLVNVERAKAGVPPLNLNPLLNKSAQLKADEMLKDGYGHINSEGKHGYSYIQDVGVSCLNTSENLDAAQTSAEAIQEWLNSAPHKQAMMSSQYDNTGFGIVEYGDFYYIVEHFCAIM